MKDSLYSWISLLEFVVYCLKSFFFLSSHRKSSKGYDFKSKELRLRSLCAKYKKVFLSSYFSRYFNGSQNSFPGSISISSTYKISSPSPSTPSLTKTATLSPLSNRTVELTEICLRFSFVISRTLTLIYWWLFIWHRFYLFARMLSGFRVWCSVKGIMSVSWLEAGG
jgi:hypothetical protein